ncbi:MAG: DNA-binding protein WhiA [Syntrophomonadaceae bacterium]|nr:DNA-binding protein WhiA [Syntrophomonadaceae bacterium]
MSFSHDTKNELARLVPERRCCQLAELSALVQFGSRLSWEGSGEQARLVVSTENAATARKAFRLFKTVFDLHTRVTAASKRQFKKNKVYLVQAQAGPDLQRVLAELGLAAGERPVERLPRRLLRSRCCKRAYARGAFLARGSINRPEGEYHLEIVCPNRGLAVGLQELVEKLGVQPRLSERKGRVVLYLKESEQIVDFLRVVGASAALLDFENVRVVKSVRNQVNRLVNCETANLEKTVEAAVRQTDSILRLAHTVGLESIPEPMRQLAVLRLDHPDCSLKELGGMCTPPLSKSGVAYRMKRLEALARKLLEAVG